jgi:ankyrin repeat protein
MLLNAIQPSESELLFATYRSGNQRHIIDLLLEGMSVDIPDQHGHTMLMLAAHDGDVAMAEFLVSQGADVNAVDAYTRSCLHHATSSSNTVLIRYLVAAGALINQTTQHGHTPLHFASRSTNLEVMDALIDLNANVHAVTAKGDTVIHQAIRSKDYTNWMRRMPDAIGRLLSAGVDPIIRNADGKTALDLVEYWLAVYAEDRQRHRVLDVVRRLLS